MCQDLAKLVSIQMTDGDIIKPSAVAFEEGFLYPLSCRLSKVARLFLSSDMLVVILLH
jgi:hypothetical protein